MTSSNQLFEKAKKLHFSGKLVEAQKVYLKLIKKFKRNDKLFFLLGTSFLQLKKYNQAIEYLNISNKLNPSFADCYNNTGIALAETGRFSEALEKYNEAIKLKINYADAYLNKSIALNNLFSFNDALECVKIAIQLRPDDPKAYNTLGNIYRNLEKFKEALDAYKKAYDIDLKYFEALSNAADLLFMFKKYSDALFLLNKIYVHNPNFEGLIDKIFSNNISICNWEKYHEITEQIKENILNRKTCIDPLTILYMTDDAELIKINSEEYVKKNQKIIDKDPLKIPKEKLDRHNEEKIKIGYFSAEFHNHPVLHIMNEIFKYHDKSKFELYAFSHGKIEEDLWRKNVKPYFKKFHLINEKSDNEVIDLVRNLKIDIAVNLTGLTKNLRTNIFVNRVAPIQINYCGFPATIGTKSINYIIGDKIVIPEENKKHFTEKVEYLPNCYLSKPQNILVKKSKKAYSRKDFNLPNSSIVFCAINNPVKINPQSLDLWVDILKDVKGSVLWLASRNEIFKNNLIKEAKKRGLEEKRIIFTTIMKEKEDHLKRLELADIFLDTFPYNSHSTMYDYIDAGLPIISLQGKSFASRVSSSIYSQIKMDKLIAKSKVEYKNIAVDLGNNKLKLNKIKKEIKDINSNPKLFNKKKFTKDLEELYIKIFKQVYSLN
ncbi:tetratricopeptide repeat protein [Candidatus Pelagibacter sp.]|nr:tetratricopeptide repeat protein [Candidatus Pelagibacter sp.]